MSRARIAIVEPDLARCEAVQTAIVARYPCAVVCVRQPDELVDPACFTPDLLIVAATRLAASTSLIKEVMASGGRVVRLGDGGSVGDDVQCGCEAVGELLTSRRDAGRD